MVTFSIYGVVVVSIKKIFLYLFRHFSLLGGYLLFVGDEKGGLL
jgi:hypothetical protein